MLVRLSLLFLLTFPLFSQNASLPPTIHSQFLDKNGKPLNGGKIYTCSATLTCPGNPLTTYQDAAETIPNTNPVILDYTGYASIRLHTLSTYKIVAYDRNDVLQWTVDNVTINAGTTLETPINVSHGGSGSANPGTGILIGNGTSPFATLPILDVPRGGIGSGNPGTGVALANGASPFTSLVTGPPGSFLRAIFNSIIPGVGFFNQADVNVRDYNFSAQTPGGTLTATTLAMVTLSPGPLGVKAADHVYISGGTGTAESVLITNGTCVGAGNVVCTIQFTPANSHSGAWTVTSSTGGYQEAYNAQNGCGSAMLSSGPRVIMHASVVMSAVCNFSWRGEALNNSPSTGPSLIQRGDDFLSGDMFSVGDGVGAEFRNFHVVNEPVTTGVSTGWAVNALGVTGNGVGYLHINNFQVYGGAGGILVDGVSTTNIHDYEWTKFSGANTGIGILFRSTHGISNQSSIITHSYFATTTFATTGIGITGLTDGVIATSNLFGGSFSAADVDVALSSASDGAFNITLNDNFFDAPNGAGVLIGGSAGALITNITIVGNHFGGSYDPATKPIQGCGIDLGFTFSNNAQNVTIANNRLFGWALGGICLGAGSGENSWLVSGNNILNNGNASASEHVGIVIKDGSHGLTITGNNITNSMAGATASQDYAIKMQGALTDATIAGNNLRGNNTGAILYTGTLTNILIKNNGGIDDATIPSVASATSIALSTASPTYSITGTVTITTFTGATHLQEQRTFVKTDTGSVTIGGGGNIPTSHTLAQNGSLTLTWNGTSWL
jgi:hypothetical protein